MPSWTSHQIKAVPTSPAKASAVILPLVSKEHIARARRESEQVRNEYLRSRVWPMRKQKIRAIASNARKLLRRKRSTVLVMLTLVTMAGVLGLNAGIWMGQSSPDVVVFSPVNAIAPAQPVAVEPVVFASLPNDPASAPSAAIADEAPTVQPNSVADESAATGQSADVALKLTPTLSLKSSPPPQKETP